MLFRRFTALLCAFALALGLWACQAEKKDGQWDYELGGFAIS